MRPHPSSRDERGRDAKKNLQENNMLQIEEGEKPALKTQGASSGENSVH